MFSFISSEAKNPDTFMTVFEILPHYDNVNDKTLVCQICLVGNRSLKNRPYKIDD